MARLSRREGADCSVSHEGSSISLTDNFSRTIPRSEGKVLPSGLSGVAGCLFPHAVVRENTFCFSDSFFVLLIHYHKIIGISLESMA